MVLFICTGNKGKLEEFKHAFKNKVDLLGINEINSFTLDKYAEPKENSDYFICNAAVKLFSAVKFLVRNSNNSEYINKIKNIIVDDSGLCIPSLDYLPGVHSATFAGEPRDDNKNILFLKNKIAENTNAEIYADEKRLKAFFVCFILSMQIDNIKNFEFVREFDFSAAVSLLANNYIEREKFISLENRLLKKVDINLAGGACSEKINASSFCPKFPENIFIDIHYGFCCGDVSTKEQNYIPGAGHGYDPLFYPRINSNLSFASIPLSEKNKVSHRALAIKKLISKIVL